MLFQCASFFRYSWGSPLVLSGGISGVNGAAWLGPGSPVVTGRLRSGLHWRWGQLCLPTSVRWWTQDQECLRPLLLVEKVTDGTYIVNQDLDSLWVCAGLPFTGSLVREIIFSWVRYVCEYLRMCTHVGDAWFWVCWHPLCQHMGWLK